MSDDLIRIGAYVYRADQLVKRGGTKDVHNDQWAREFALCVPVLQPTFWSRSDVQSTLTEALGFATDDTWRFSFSQAPETIRDQIGHQQRLDTAGLVEGPGSIVLFSGGLDSLSILLEARNRGERPMAVGHWSAPPIQSRQVRLIDQVSQTPYGLRTVPLFSAWIHGYGHEAVERTRRARGFLFACLGGAVAGKLGVQRVYFGDNGPISLNLPINDQLTGAHVSCSTHPVFLECLNTLMALVYDADTPPVFSNPLQAKTRVDCLQSIVDAGFASLIPQTNSCAH